ncbi:hypothetical protein [Actinomadura oligospora]|uniref:hypothetical protein n=1 Tax=Actinomadura oligospora TaxID=111804 RepID=UPI0004B067B1|nr:hypothetical protein [Actinomadura oligospora]
MPFVLDAVVSSLPYYLGAGHWGVIVIGLIVVVAVLVALRIVMVRRHHRGGHRH